MDHKGWIKLTYFCMANMDWWVHFDDVDHPKSEIASLAAHVYSLVIVMYEMLTGHPPFDGDSPAAVAIQHIRDVPTLPSQSNPNIPTALEEIIMRCLEKELDMRFRDGTRLVHTLGPLM